MTAPIIKYTTQISEFKTIAEIEEILANYGATDINKEYESGKPIRLIFTIMHKEEKLAFRMPIKWEAVFNILKGKKRMKNSDKTRDQAIRVAWRLAKHWVEGQIAYLQSEMIEFEQAFFAYRLVRDENGKAVTLYDKYKDQKLLNASNND